MKGRGGTVGSRWVLREAKGGGGGGGGGYGAGLLV